MKRSFALLALLVLSAAACRESNPADPACKAACNEKNASCRAACADPMACVQRCDDDTQRCFKACTQ